MLVCVSERLCLHLNRLRPGCYIHVNMAKAGAVTAALLMSEEKTEEEQKAGSLQGDGVLATDETGWQLGSGCVETAARQRGMDDSVAVRVKYNLHSRPNTH